ncbi:MAG: hypothetical protein WCA79_06815 [Anaerolineales bacterium]
MKTKIAELMAQEVREKMEERVQIGEIEQTMRALAKEASGIGLQKVIEGRKEKYPVPIACSCGQEAEPWGKREGMVWSVFGKVTYRRRYYWCPHCHRGSRLWTSD